jgi:hypothetical protein
MGLFAQKRLTVSNPLGENPIMNRVDSLVHEINELNEMEALFNRHHKVLNNKPFDQLTPKEAERLGELVSILPDIRERLSALQLELKDARKINDKRRDAWHKSHPTFADIWPQPATRK